MIVLAPATRAPMMALKPTPPIPNTATELPGVTRAVLTTAPTPVTTAQPNKAAVASWTEASIFTSDSCAATVNCENAETPRWWLTAALESAKWRAPITYKTVALVFMLDVQGSCFDFRRTNPWRCATRAPHFSLAAHDQIRCCPRET